MVMLRFMTLKTSFAFIGQDVQNSTMTLGHKVMHNFGIHQDAYWYWLGVGTLIGYMILFNALYTLTLTYLDRKHSFLLNSLFVEDCLSEGLSFAVWNSARFLG